MISTLYELADAKLQNPVSICPDTKQPCIAGRTGRVYKSADGFVWTRNGTFFHAFSPDSDREMGVCVTACQLLFRPYREQRAYRKRQAQLVASTMGRRAAKRQKS